MNINQQCTYCNEFENGICFAVYVGTLQTIKSCSAILIIINWFTEWNNELAVNCLRWKYIYAV